MRNASGHQCLWPSGALINGVPGYSTVLSSDDGMIYLSFPTQKTKEVDNGAKNYYKMALSKVKVK